MCKSIFAWNSAQYVEVERNKYFKRKKDATTFSLQACFVNRFTKQACRENVVASSFLLYIYIYLLKTELLILDFQHFHWLAGYRLSAHIPALPNMVNESINKESWIKIFPRNWRPLKIV